MIPVTSNYTTAISSPSRKTRARVIFEIIDTTAASDSTETATSQASISRLTQVTDGIRQMSGKYATNEDNYTLLDGSFVLPPKTTNGTYQIGWWSNLLSGTGGTFSTPQLITCQFTTNHSSIGITVTFDSNTNEYADSFEIRAYNSSNALINSISVTGNTLSKYIWSQNLSNYRKIEVYITKWKTANRRVRITEIDFGIVEEYNGDELIQTTVLEEVSPTSQEVTTNELSFTVDNQDKRFNILNPNGVYSYLQRRQKIYAYLGVETLPDTYEDIPMGIYYLNEWKSDEGTLTATFTARDVFDILDQSLYRKANNASITLYNLAVAILTDAGITDYTIDSALNSITVNNYMPIVTHRQALQYVAVAGKAVCYSDRYGKVIIKQLSTAPSGKTIDFANSYNTPAITLDKLINNIDTNVYSLVAGGSETVYSGTIAISGTQSVWIQYKEPASAVSAAVSGGTLNSATYYTNAALLTITAAGNVTITATGTKQEPSTSSYILTDPSTPVGELAYTLKVDNPLINTTANASAVASWILAEQKKRNIYDCNWRQDMSYEAGDIVTIEDEFGSDYNARITSHTFDFNGALTGKTTGKGSSV